MARPEKRSLSARRVAARLYAVAVLAGCTTTDDPHAGGFVSGVTNLANGGYDRRVQARQTELTDLAEINSQLDKRHAEIEAERTRLRAERDALTAQLKQVELNNTAARQRLADARQTKGVAQARLTALIAEQRAIEAEIVPLVRRAQLRAQVIPASFGDSTAADTPAPEDAAALDIDRQKAAALAERQSKVNQVMDEVLGPAPK